jgi:hypothetical protein
MYILKINPLRLGIMEPWLDFSHIFNLFSVMESVQLKQSVKGQRLENFDPMSISLDHYVYMSQGFLSETGLLIHLFYGFRQFAFS